MVKGIEPSGYPGGKKRSKMHACLTSFGTARPSAGFASDDQRTNTAFFRSLSHQTVAALSGFPIHLAADAAFDARYVYEHAVRHGGIAAVPLNAHTRTHFDPDGMLLCPQGLRMHPTYRYAHTYGYFAQRYRCLHLFPAVTGQTGEHEQFQKGRGYQKDINDEVGGRVRVLLNRSGPLSHVIYDQRTRGFCINSQSQALGLERPRVRNARSVANLNTLTYLIITARSSKSQIHQ